MGIVVVLIMVLACHVILEDHVIKGSYNMGGEWHRGSGDDSVSLSRYLARPHDQRVRVKS